MDVLKTTRAGASEWRDAGFLVLPGRANTKAPLGAAGHGRPNGDGTRGWGYSLYREPGTPLPPLTDFGTDKAPLLCVLGGGDTGLIMLEREGKGKTSDADEAAIPQALADIEDEDRAQRCLDAWERINNGCVDTTPTGGVHWYVRVQGDLPPGINKIAHNEGGEVTWEIKGHRDLTVAAPCPPTSKHIAQGWTAPYARRTGCPANIPEIALDDFLVIRQVIALLFNRGETFDRGETTGSFRELPDVELDGMPTWHTILCEWNDFKPAPGPGRYLRAGGDATSTSSLVAEEGHRLKCFSSSIPEFSTVGSYSKTQAVAALHFGGSVTDAQRFLGSKAKAFNIEPQPEFNGQPVSLAEYRKRASSIALEEPGIYVSRSQTGTGKTEQAIRMLPADEPSMICLPTHKNCEELLERLTAAGIDASKTPPLTEDTCHNLEKAEAARNQGLPIGETVCAECPFKRGCLYRELSKKAAEARVLVTTHARATVDRSVFEVTPRSISSKKRRQTKERALEEAQRITRLGYEQAAIVRQKVREETRPPRTFVVIDETPQNVLAPAICVSASDFKKAIGILYHLIESDIEDKYEAQALPKVLPRALDACVAALNAPAWQPVTDLLQSVMPGCWGKSLRRALVDGCRSGAPPRVDAIAALTAITFTNPAQRLESVVKFEDTDKDGVVTEYIQVNRSLIVSEGTTVLCLDATANPDALHATDVTPVAHVLPERSVRHVPRDVTAAMTPETVLREFVEPFLLMNPGIRRLGTIGHSSHIKAIQAKNYRQVAKTAYFQSGDDASSNEWNRECDHLLVLGTPRRPSSAIRSELIRRGKVEAARIQPEFGERHWESPIGPVAYYGYLDEDWHGVCVDVDRARLLQAIGRARVLDAGNGIDVTVFTSQPLPYAGVVDFPSAAAAEIYDLTRYSPRETTVDELRSFMERLFKAGLCSSVASMRAIRRHLKSLVDLGLMFSPWKGYYTHGPVKISRQTLCLRREGCGRIADIASKYRFDPRRFIENCEGYITAGGFIADHRPDFGIYWGYWYDDQDQEPE